MTHNVERVLGDTLVTQLEGLSEPLCHHPHQRAFFGIKFAGDRGQPLHRGPKLLERSRQVAALAAGDRCSQTLAEFADNRPCALSDSDLEFAQVVREFEERVERWMVG